MCKAEEEAQAQKALEEAERIKEEAKATAEATSKDKEDGKVVEAGTGEPANGKEKSKIESLRIDTPAASCIC